MAGEFVGTATFGSLDLHGAGLADVFIARLNAKGSSGVAGPRSDGSRELVLSPNPTTGILRVQGAGADPVRVLSLDGAVRIVADDPERIDLGSLDAGVYFVSAGGRARTVIVVR